MIPHRLNAPLFRYVQERIPTGGFLRACLENDLLRASCAADDINAGILRDIMRHIANELPGECWGSREKVKEWLAGRGEASGPTYGEAFAGHYRNPADGSVVPDEEIAGDGGGRAEGGTP